MNLEQRVAALESLTSTLSAQSASARASARRWRFTALAAGMAMVAGVGIAANQGRQVQDVITAQTIEIVNDNDDVVLELTSDSHGGIIRLFNNDGDLVGSFEVYDEGGFLAVYDNDENPMAVVRCDDFGGIFAINNARGNRAASMEVDGAGGIITVRSSTNDSVGAMLDIMDNYGRLLVNNSAGREREVKP